MVAVGDLARQLARPEEVALLERALASGDLEVVARGISMRPALRAGDRVRLAQRAPRRGDVALVALADRVVLHRLVGRRGRHWRVRGDAHPRCDGWVEPERILAVATGFRRGAESDDRNRWHRLDRAPDRWRGLLLARLVRGARGLRRGLPGPLRGRGVGAAPTSRDTSAPD